MKKTYQITETGKADLEVELAELKGRRSEIAEKIAVARDFGDLSENAEYDAAREEQGLVETRILEIEDILQNAEIIKSSGTSSMFIFMFPILLTLLCMINKTRHKIVEFER